MEYMGQVGPQQVKFTREEGIDVIPDDSGATALGNERDLGLRVKMIGMVECRQSDSV